MSISLGQCKHFRGIQHDTCEAGVPTASVKGDNPAGLPFRVTWACMKEGQHIPCALREMPTAEEIAADRAETERTLAAMERGDCPTCGGKLLRKDHPRGFVAWCPKCPDISMRGCRGLPT
jgi:hypothetical protein